MSQKNVRVDNEGVINSVGPRSPFAIFSLKKIQIKRK